MKTYRIIFLAIALAGIFAAMPCQAPAQATRMYKNDAMGIEVQYPQDYTVKRVDATSVVFVSPLADKKDAFAENVNITVTSVDTKTKLDDLVESSKATIEKIFKDVTFLEEKKTTVAGLPAFRLVYVSKQKMTFFKFMQVIVINNTKVYALTYTALEDDYQRYVSHAQIMFDSLRFKKLSK